MDWQLKRHRRESTTQQEVIYVPFLVISKKKQVTWRHSFCESCVKWKNFDWVTLLSFLGNQSHGVLPGETHTYSWRVVDEDEPLESDSRCLTRIYHSAVNTPRDIASGLIGPILICKTDSLNVRNVQVKNKFSVCFAGWLAIQWTEEVDECIKCHINFVTYKS